MVNMSFLGRIYLVPNVDRFATRESLKEIHRVLRPGATLGMIVSQVPAVQVTSGADPWPFSIVER